MRCDEIMKTELECVSPDDTVEIAACTMRDEDVGFLPVCNDLDSVLGVITDRDIALRVVAEGRPLLTRVEEVMTPEVVACAPDDDLETAERLMQQHQKSRIVCIDDTGELVGVISLSDIAAYDPGDGAVETLRQVADREVHVQG